MGLKGSRSRRLRLLSLGFNEPVPGIHNAYPVAYRSIKERTLLADLTAAGKQMLLLDLPLTFPAPEINGHMADGGEVTSGDAPKVLA